ncbi:aldolase/citrate lyase family protein [Haloarcula sp. S1AR25-5A]|uniref:Aldolase/citrate lyase family protein n=1 Tax=Haloarcula terrestris TaxID=2950533 RepID=A0AAE4F3F3_9EURY|nr:aldolase/citrate lyase family protein [Haloarcula terrestris]MDS0223576.1 aldolase/citrate lyase family protein [Haloarcula terrestris]
MTHLKDTIESADNPFGTWISVGHPTIAEATAQLDLDFVLVDMEHTTMDLETVESMARGVDAAPGDTDMIVRVPWNDPVRLKRVIDIGVAGVMVPMISSAEEAEELVRSLRYPPDGIRGIAGSRATRYGKNFEEYVTNANGSILTIAQIETEQGMEHAQEIANVEGIDSLFVGPADLSGSLGMFAEWDSSKFDDAVQSIIDDSHAADVPVGTLTTDIGAEAIESRVDQGFDFLIAGKDVALLMDSVEVAIDNYAEALDKPVSASDD